MRPFHLILPAGQPQEVSFDDIRSLIDPYIEKMLGKITPKSWGWQRLFEGSSDIDFEYIERMPKQSDWIHHLSGKSSGLHVGWHKNPDFPKNSKIEKLQGKYMRGALGFRGVFQEDEVRWLCLDIDDSKSVNFVRSEYQPFLLKKYGIKTLWEYGGRDFDRGKLWMFVKSDIGTLREFFDKTWLDSGCLYKVREKNKEGRDSRYKLEFYPVRKPSNLLRLPGGFHLRANQVMPVYYQGKDYETVPKIMEAIINAEEYDTDFLNECIDKKVVFTLPPSKEQIKREKREKRKAMLKEHKMLYKSMNLTVPIEGLTQFGEKMCKNCPAIHRMMKMVKDGFLESSGDDVHHAGLYISGLFQYSKHALKYQYSDVDVDHEAFIDEMRDEFFAVNRSRPEDSHNWKITPAHIDSYAMFVPSCQEWKNQFDHFNICRGCINDGRTDFKSPKDFWYGVSFKLVETDAEVEGNVKELLSVEDIATRNKAELRAEMVRSLKNGAQVNVSNQSPQGTRKSVSADELMTEFARKNYKFGLAVPSGELAIEHGARLRKSGVSFLYLMSWASTFEFLDLDFDCPYDSEIRPCVKLDILDASQIRSKYCKNCEYNDVCPFFTEWKRLEEGDFEVVILQHAHLKSSVSLRKLKQANLDGFIIDEDFLGAVRTYFKITKEERTLINKFAKRFKWMNQVAHWLHGREVNRNPTKTFEELEYVSRQFQKENVKFRVVEILRMMAEGATYNKYTGVMLIHEIPGIPLKINLDATATEDQVKTAFKSDKLTVIGNNQLIDPRLQHPDNELIQIVDASSSVTSHEDKETFLRQIDADCMDVRENSWIRKALVTVFKNEIEHIEEYIQENHADIANRVTVSYMKTGVNEWADFDAQYLHASIHLSTKEINQQNWENITVENDFRLSKDEEELSACYPYKQKSDDSISTIDVPVYVFMRRSDGKAHKMKMPFPQIKRRIPTMQNKQKPVTHMEGKTQQAIRVRMLPGKRRKVVVYSNFRLYGFCFTSVQMWQERLAWLRRTEEKQKYEQAVAAYKENTDFEE